MANKRVDPEKKVVPISGCVYAPVKERIEAEANARGIRVSKMVAEILTEWVYGAGMAGLGGREEETLG